VKIRNRKDSAFTLLEVILAVVIAVGLLMVAISFYQQSARLRGEMLRESERLTAVRLVMDRMSTDLRTAVAEPREGFTGSAGSMRFAHSDVGGLMVVSYEGAFEGIDTNAVMIGINRIERLLVESAPIGSATGTNAVPFSFTGDDLFGTNNLAAAAPEPTTRAIKHARFRFYDGRQWLESWSAVNLPMGVEISLGLEAPAMEDLLTTNAPTTEVFKRVVFLPAGRMASTNEFEMFEEAL
jgi:type II secretory pathway pseudopilin PulG